MCRGALKRGNSGVPLVFFFCFFLVIEREFLLMYFTSPHLTRVMESGFRETTEREITFPYSAETFLRFKKWLQSKHDSRSSSFSSAVAHSNSDHSDDAVSSTSASPSDSPEKKSSSGSKKSEAEESGSGSGAGDSGSSSGGLFALNELLSVADQYMEGELLEQVAIRILDRPIVHFSDFALSFSLAFSLDRRMPERASIAKQQCLAALARELMTDMPYLSCHACSVTEHYGYPVSIVVPACRCDSCHCFRASYLSASVFPLSSGSTCHLTSCSCRAQLIARICNQRRYAHNLDFFSSLPALQSAIIELAEMGDVEPVAELASISESLIPFHEPRFAEALSEAQMLHLLQNTVTGHGQVSDEHVQVMELKAYHRAAACAKAIIAKRASH